MADRGIPVVSPNARKRRYWDMMILVFVIYNAVAVPLDAGERLSCPAGCLVPSLPGRLLWPLEAEAVELSRAAPATALRQALALRRRIG